MLIVLGKKRKGKLKEDLEEVHWMECGSKTGEWTSYLSMVFEICFYMKLAGDRPR